MNQKSSHITAYNSVQGMLTGNNITPYGCGCLLLGANGSKVRIVAKQQFNLLKYPLKPLPNHHTP